jgi:hypothetical protein
MLRKTLLTIAVGVVALASGASPSQAVQVEYFFGDNNPTTGTAGCVAAPSRQRRYLREHADVQRKVGWPRHAHGTIIYWRSLGRAVGISHLQT